MMPILPEATTTNVLDAKPNANIWLMKNAKAVLKKHAHLRKNQKQQDYKI